MDTFEELSLLCRDDKGNCCLLTHPAVLLPSPAFQFIGVIRILFDEVAHCMIAGPVTGRSVGYEYFYPAPEHRQILLVLRVPAGRLLKKKYRLSIHNIYLLLTWSKII
jgi:hypothetical protein